MLSRLTARGRLTLGRVPGRILEVNHEVEQHGCEVVAQFALLGSYDFATIIAARDNAAMHKVAEDLGGRGTLITLTMPALPTDAYIAFLKQVTQGGPLST
jgi:uncharacterized protein with GYD domain